jgi:hypothetical protein
MGKVLEAAGLPNEYNTATFIQYGPIIGPGSVFFAFFQDPEIQRSLHVRGSDLPGLNFKPEAVTVPQVIPTRRALSSSSEYYYPMGGWGPCSDAVVSLTHPTIPVVEYLGVNIISVCVVVCDSTFRACTLCLYMTCLGG